MRPLRRPRHQSQCRIGILVDETNVHSTNLKHEYPITYSERKAPEHTGTIHTPDTTNKDIRRDLRTPFGVVLNPTTSDGLFNKLAAYSRG